MRWAAGQALAENVGKPHVARVAVPAELLLPVPVLHGRWPEIPHTAEMAACRLHAK